MDALSPNKSIDNLLQKLKGNKIDYKRYLGAPIRYGGGKSLAVGYIIERIPRNIKKIVSPFVGGGSVEFALNECGINVICYDIFDKLINFFNVLKNEKVKLIKTLKTFNASKQTFNNIRKELWDDYKQTKFIKNNIELASKYFYNHNLSYGPSYLGWPSSNYLNNNKKYQKMIDKLSKYDLERMIFKCEPFENVLPKHVKDFMYLDPPYFLGGTSKMFAGIYPMRNSPHHHKDFDHKLLSNLLRQHAGGFLLSYNDCKEIRDLYKGFEIVELHWQYTMGQGETRIGKNRAKRNYDNTNTKQSHEILIIGGKR